MDFEVAKPRKIRLSKKVEKKSKKLLTHRGGFDMIPNAPVNKGADTERYRSGHNEAVLKTVCLHGHMGSNPILSGERYFALTSALEKYPSWPKGLPWKGSRSLIAARGFKSLLLRSDRKI